MDIVSGVRIEQGFSFIENQKVAQSSVGPVARRLAELHVLGGVRAWQGRAACPAYSERHFDAFEVGADPSTLFDPNTPMPTDGNCS